MVIKVMRYQIIKPIDDDWETLGTVLRLTQRETRKALNRAIQLCWDYEGFSTLYKEKYGEYPSEKDVLRYSSRHGYVYNILKNECSLLNTGNLSQTIKRACDKWKTDLKKVRLGDCSIPNYKKDVPLDIVANTISKIEKIDGEYILTVSLISNFYRKELNRKNCQFRLLIRVGDKSQRDIIERIMHKEYGLGASQIIYRNKKWFINLTYKFESEVHELNEEYVMGIDMGIANTLYMAFNHSLHRYNISKSEVDKFRKSVEKRKKIMQQQGKYCGDVRIGHGTKTRIQPSLNISDKIARFRANCNHKYARYAVKMALRHKCKIIQLEDLSGISKDETALKGWTYYDLQRNIKNKAEEVGIQVIIVNPRYTSQRCSKCGHIAKENRIYQAKFKCTNIGCGFETHADFNAARNLATPYIDKIIGKELGAM